MRLGPYLEARHESQYAFSKRCGVPTSTLNLIFRGGGAGVDTGLKIVKASREAPAPDGATITFEDLVPVGVRAAVGRAS